MKELPPCENIVVHYMGVFKFLLFKFLELETDG
jgi:hypothetical protein